MFSDVFSKDENSQKIIYLIAIEIIHYRDVVEYVVFMIFNMIYDAFMQHAQYQILSSLNLFSSALDHSLMCYCCMLINHCLIVLKIKYKRTLTVKMLYFLLQFLFISRSFSDHLFIYL